MNTSVASEQNFKAYQGVDLIPWTGEDAIDPAVPAHHRLLKSTTVAEFTAYMAEQLNLDADLIRPWIMVNRQNGTVRPDHPLTWPDMTLQEASDKFSTRSAGFRVFIEETTRGSDGEPAWPKDVPSSPATVSQQPKQIIIFLKYFDVDRQQLRGMGHIYMNTQDKVQDLATPILEMMNWEAGTVNIQLFEEIKQNYVEIMKPKQTLLASEIQDGDIIVFQRHLSEQETEALKQTNSTACLNPIQYYDFLMNRLFVSFSPKTVPVANLQLQNEADEKFTIALSKKDTYDILAQKVADHLSTVNATAVNPSHIRFTTTNAQTSKPRTIVKRQQATTVNTILLGSTAYGGYNYAPSQASDHLFYEVLEMSLADLEQRKNVRVTWLTEGITKEEVVDILVHKQSQFTGVLETLQKRLELPEDVASNLRFYEAHGHKVYKTLPLTHAVVSLNEFMTIYAERVPEEELELSRQEVTATGTAESPEGDRLINCFHFEKEPSKGHGIPFVFLLKEGEIFKETKERLSKRTGIKGKNFEKVRFALIKGGATYSRPVWIEDDDILSEKLNADDQLGLEHPNRNRNNWMRYESLNIK